MKLKLGKVVNKASPGEVSHSLPKDIILPNHIAIIPDGNRRWARARGLPGIEGHRKGAQTLRDLVKACRDWGIHTFTFWGFSTENWTRQREEVESLLGVIERMLDRYVDEAMENKMRLVHLGRKDRLPEALLRKIQEIEDKTKGNDKYVFNLALDYGGHDEIVRAARKIVSDKVPAEKIDEKLFSSYLDTGDQPYPYVDLMIRTSVEQRTSGFMPWQMEYAEIWWEDAHFPDFTPSRLAEAILDYSRRRRRFGADDKVKKLTFSPHLVARLELDWWRAKKLHETVGFRKAISLYIKEQFGISLSLARKAAEIFVKAALLGEEKGEWKRAKRLFFQFYRFIKRNVKLAFEPSLVASLEVEYLRGSNGDRERRAELQQILTKLYAELFRISLLQANKIAHLRVLAHSQEEQVQNSGSPDDKKHKNLAEEYLIRSYEALKERVA